MIYTADSAAAALAAGETTIEQIAAETGWPVVEGCLVPEPDEWHADDGNAEIVEEHDSGLEAAQSYVDGGEWGDPDDETCWITVHVWREGIDADGDEVRVNEKDHKIAIDPDEPDCIEGEDHDWQAPQSIVGGCDQNPGVYASGGGVEIHEVCMRCGTEKIKDTWAQDRSDGQQGLISLRYEAGKYADEVQAAEEL